MISRYLNLLIGETLSFSAKIFAEIFLVIFYNIINLNNNKRGYKLNISTNNKSSKLIIASA